VLRLCRIRHRKIRVGGEAILYVIPVVRDRFEEAITSNDNLFT